MKNYVKEILAVVFSIFATAGIVSGAGSLQYYMSGGTAIPGDTAPMTLQKAIDNLTSSSTATSTWVWTATAGHGGWQASIGGVPVARNLTINGTTYDLSADRNWTISAVSESDPIFIAASSTFVTGTPWTGMGYLTSLNGAVLTDQTSGQTVGDTTNRLAKLWATDITATNAIAGSVTGNAGTATKLAATKTINGVAFDGSGNITVPSDIAAGTSGNLMTSNGTVWTSAAVPTWNQNTTGSAAKWTTARNLAGNSVDGSGNVAFSNKFIVQGATDSGLSGAQFLGALGTGLVKNTTSTGVLSIAAAGTDYQAPLTYPVTGVASPTAGYLTKWGASGNAIVDGPKLGTLTDGKWCSFSTAGGIACTENVPGGAGATTALDNLASVAINTSLLPGTSDGAALGSTTKMFSDLFLAPGGVLNYGNGNMTLTQSTDTLTLAGTASTAATFYSSGIVDTPNQSGCHAYRATPNYTLANDTNTKIPLTGENWDNQGEYDKTTNYRFTATKAGVYQVEAQILWDAFVSGKRYQLQIRKNGDIGSGFYSSYTAPGSTEFGTQHAMALLKLAVGDYVELWAYQNTGSNVTIDYGAAETWMMVNKVQ
jgi:hypothetical protein